MIEEEKLKIHAIGKDDKSPINEDAYLSEEDEKKLVNYTQKIMLDKKMNTKEKGAYLKQFPSLRKMAELYRDILGEKMYRELEQRNIDAIKKREWEQK